MALSGLFTNISTPADILALEAKSRTDRADKVSGQFSQPYARALSFAADKIGHDLLDPESAKLKEARVKAGLVGLFQTGALKATDPVDLMKGAEAAFKAGQPGLAAQLIDQAKTTQAQLAKIEKQKLDKKNTELTIKQKEESLNPATLRRKAALQEAQTKQALAAAKELELGGPRGTPAAAPPIPTPKKFRDYKNFLKDIPRLAEVKTGTGAPLLGWFASNLLDDDKFVRSNMVTVRRINGEAKSARKAFRFTPDPEETATRLAAYVADKVQKLPVSERAEAAIKIQRNTHVQDLYPEIFTTKVPEVAAPTPPAPTQQITIDSVTIK